MFWLPTVAFSYQNLLGSVPFAFSKGELVAQVRISGKGPFTVLLDTGTAPSIIDLSLARQLGIKTESTGQSGTGGGSGKSQFYIANLPWLELNGWTLNNMSSLAMDLSSLGQKLGRHLDGVLGDSVFDGRVVQFDYPGTVARFFRKSPNLSGVKFHFVHSSNEIHLEGVRVNGRQISANLDTGSNTAFQLTPRGLRKLHLNGSASHARIKQAAGFNGAYQSRSGKVTSVDLGPIHLSQPRATFWLSGTGHDDSEFDVNIGNDFLRTYVVTIDYVEHVVTLTKNASVAAPKTGQRVRN